MESKSNKETHILFIMDTSGSMVNFNNAPLESFNNFIKEQKSLNIDNTFLTLIEFNNNVNLVFNKNKIENIPILNEFHPKGMTALYDAIGEGIELLRDYSDVSVLIFTDGFENSSTKFNRKIIKELITKMETNFSWKFVYLAANQDAFLIGESIGIKNCATFDNTEEGLNEITREVSSGLTRLRSGESDCIEIVSAKLKKQKPTPVICQDLYTPYQTPKSPKTPTTPLKLKRSNCMTLSPLDCSLFPDLDITECIKTPPPF